MRFAFTLERAAIAILSLLLIRAWWWKPETRAVHRDAESSQFAGAPSWKVDNDGFKTLASRSLAVSRWMTLESHDVLAKNSGQTIKDWWFFEEPNHVNVS